MPLLVSEQTSAACKRFWDDADTIVSCRLLYVESAAAVAQAQRLGRITTRMRVASVARLDELWDQIAVIEIDDALTRRAAALAARFGLRGYDAVHCASAEQLADPDLVAAAGDGQLLGAWHELGIATFDTNGTGGGL